MDKLTRDQEARIYRLITKRRIIYVTRELMLAGLTHRQTVEQLNEEEADKFICHLLDRRDGPVPPPMPARRAS